MLTAWTILVRKRERTLAKLHSPLAQSVSKTASKTSNTIFRMLIVSKDNFMFPKNESHMETVRQDTDMQQK